MHTPLLITRIMWRTMFALVAVIYILFLLNANIPFNGRKDVGGYLIGEAHPLMGVWSGQGVGELGNEGDMRFRHVANHQLYVDARSPVSYQKAAIYLTYRGLGGVKIGTQAPHQAFVPLAVVGQRGEWVSATGIVDLTAVPRNNGKYTLVLSFDEGEGDLSTMRVQLEGKTLWERLQSVAQSF